MTASPVRWQKIRPLSQSSPVCSSLTKTSRRLTLGEEHGFPEWLEWGRWFHGWALAELGDIARGVAEMEAGIAGFVSVGGAPRQAFTAAMLAKGYEKLGRIDQAIAMLDDQ
jgi:hypothetical protein